MKYILTIEEIERIKLYLEGNSSWAENMNRFEKNTFSKKASSISLANNQVFLKQNENFREVIADNDPIRQKTLFDLLHLPSHTGMKAMWEKC